MASLTSGSGFSGFRLYATINAPPMQTLRRPHKAALVLVAGWSLALPAVAEAQLAAFPSASGFGAATTGGRGGPVVHVTTLAASGAGSLAAAAAMRGARIIVFDVSGVIEGDVEISSGDVTIAGQTAPGAGITIRGHLSTPFGDRIGNIIVRHVRVRPPGAGGEWTPEQHDAIQMSDGRRIIFDHVDVSHGIDENVDHYDGASEITWQSSILSFPNPMGGHPEGAHPYCLLNSDGGSDGAAGGKVSIVGNLFAHCRTRTPALAQGPAEVINNVVYDGREGFVHHNPAYGDFVIAGNTYRKGPSASLAPFWFDAENDNPPTRYYMGDNAVDDPGVFTGTVDNPFTTPGFADEYDIVGDTVDSSQFYPLAMAPTGTPTWARVAPARVPAATAYDRVLACAGAWPRDVVSTTAVDETRARGGSIRNLTVANLLAGLTPGAAPTDTDRDGMPDAWESAHGLDPNADDHNAAMTGGWPALDVYLEERSVAITCPGGTPLPAGTGGSAGTGAGGADRRRHRGDVRDRRRRQRRARRRDRHRRPRGRGRHRRRERRRGFGDRRGREQRRRHDGRQRDVDVRRLLVRHRRRHERQRLPGPRLRARVRRRAALIPAATSEALKPFAGLGKRQDAGTPGRPPGRKANKEGQVQIIGIRRPGVPCVLAFLFSACRARTLLARAVIRARGVREIAELVASSPASLGYETVPFDLGDRVHREGLLRLWAGSMSDARIAEVAPARLRWFYQENPVTPPRTLLALAPASIDAPAREVVGCGSAFTRRMRVLDRTLQAGILCDFAVAPAHRLGGAALGIQRAIIAGSRPAGQELLIAFPNKLSMPIFKRAGYRVVAESRAWVKPLHSHYKLKGRLKLPAAARLTSWIVDAGLRASDLARAPRGAGATGARSSTAPTRASTRSGRAPPGPRSSPGNGRRRSSTGAMPASRPAPTGSSRCRSAPPARSPASSSTPSRARRCSSSIRSPSTWARCWIGCSCASRPRCGGPATSRCSSTTPAIRRSLTGWSGSGSRAANTSRGASSSTRTPPRRPTSARPSPPRRAG